MQSGNEFQPYVLQTEPNSSFSSNGTSGRMRPFIPISAALRIKRSFHRKDHIGIGHKQQGNGGFFPDAYHHLKDFISCHTAGEGAFIGSLDDGAFRCRVGKGNAKLNKISPASSMA